MFLVVYNIGDAIEVLDTLDNNKSTITYGRALALIDLGIDILGCRVNRKSGKLVIKCKSGMDICKSYIEETSQVIAKMRLLQRDSKKKELELEEEALYKLAKEYGAVQSREQFAVDLDRNIVSFNGALNKIITYGGTDKGTVKNEVDIRDENVSKLSRLGSACFDMIYLYVDTKDKKVKVTLREVLEEVCNISEDNIEDISYVGITPSNNMFKIIIFSSCWSVKVDLIGKIIKNKDKILGTKTVKMPGFNKYIRWLEDDGTKQWAISKMSLKEGRLYSGMGALHQKYPTLHDVYIEKSWQ